MSRVVRDGHRRRGVRTRPTRVGLPKVVDDRNGLPGETDGVGRVGDHVRSGLQGPTMGRSGVDGSRYGPPVCGVQVTGRYPYRFHTK